MKVQFTVEYDENGKSKAAQVTKAGGAKVTAGEDNKTYGDFRSSQAAEILPPLGNFAELKFWQVCQIICQTLANNCFAKFFPAAA